MACLIHHKPDPCPDCARAKLKIPPKLAPKLPAPKPAQHVEFKPVLNPEPVPLSAVLPPKTRIEVVGGKRLLKCQYNILGCAGPKPGDWLTKGYTKCPQCTSAPAGPQYRPSLVPTAWAVCLQDIYKDKQPKFFKKDWTSTKTREEMADEIYDHLRGLGVGEVAVGTADFLNWYDSIKVPPESPTPQFAQDREKEALKNRKLMPAQTDLLAKDFYWYWHPHGGNKNALARVYMNLEPSKAPDVYRWIVGKFVNDLGLDLATGVKIAGPGTSRTDTIVLYLHKGSDADRQKAVDLIASGIDSGQISQAAFRKPLAAFTHPTVYKNVTIAGISTGAEPPLGPSHIPTKSLGTATAECITDALLEIKKSVDAKRDFPNGTLVFFLETTWQNMKREGLEHSQPI
jgi:hypothetical protein